MPESLDAPSGTDGLGAGAIGAVASAVVGADDSVAAGLPEQPPLHPAPADIIVTTIVNTVGMNQGLFMGSSSYQGGSGAQAAPA